MMMKWAHTKWIILSLCGWHPSLILNLSRLQMCFGAKKSNSNWWIRWCGNNRFGAKVNLIKCNCLNYYAYIWWLIFGSELKKNETKKKKKKLLLHWIIHMFAIHHQILNVIRLTQWVQWTSFIEHIYDKS